MRHYPKFLCTFLLVRILCQFRSKCTITSRLTWLEVCRETSTTSPQLSFQGATVSKLPMCSSHGFLNYCSRGADLTRATFNIPKCLKRISPRKLFKFKMLIYLQSLKKTIGWIFEKISGKWTYNKSSNVVLPYRGNFLEFEI